MAELHNRNIALQSRIGNLEDILRQQLDPVRHVTKRSWEQSRTSFVNTEENEKSVRQAATQYVLRE